MKTSLHINSEVSVKTDNLKDYPCSCKSMRWMVDHNKVFKKQGDGWFLTWIELDRNGKGINIENFAVKIDYCLFCGRKIN